MKTLPHPIRIQDVAEMAGVSASTVSRVMNRSGYVSASVRAKVEAVVAQTGYTPSAIAKDLKRRQSRLVGVIIPQINSFTAGGIVAGLSKVLSEHGFSVLLANVEHSSDEEIKALELFRAQRVNGVLILAAGMDARWQAAVKQLHVPVVVSGQDATAFGIPSVIQNERAATGELVDYLWRCGHREFGFIGVSETDIQIGTERKRGFDDALTRHGQTLSAARYVTAPGFEFSDGSQAVDTLLTQNTGSLPSAIFAVTDRLAIGAIRRLADRQVKVPEEISVVGMGDIDLANLYQPRLTTVHYNYFSTGEHAARLLINRMQTGSDTPQRLVLKYEIKIRESVKRLLG